MLKAWTEDRRNLIDGIDPHLTVNDRSGRPVPIAQGADPIREILA